MWPNVPNSITENWLDKDEPFSPWLDSQHEQVEMVESMVKQALRAQSEWSEAVTDQIVSTPGIPDAVAAMTRQMQDFTENLIEFQTQAWDGWFSIVRGVESKVENRSPVVQLVADSEPPTEPTVADAVERALDSKPSTAALDDLKAISGVGQVLSDKLNGRGVTSYRQIAAWTDEEITEIESAIVPARFAGRIRRDDWIGQAKALHFAKYDEKL